MGCDDVQARVRRAIRAGQGEDNVQIFELCADKVFNATTSAANGFDEYVLTDEEFEVLGPRIQDLVFHSEGSNFVGAFQYRVIIQWKYNNGAWNSDTTTLVQPLKTNELYAVGTPYSIRTSFGRRIRLLLQVNYASGTTNHTGSLTASVAVRFWS